MRDRIGRLAWTLAGGLLLIAAVRTVRIGGEAPTVAPAFEGSVLAQASANQIDSSRMNLSALANLVVERNPFRPERRQAPLLYSRDPMPTSSAAPPPPPPPPKPALIVRGILGGSRWEAILDGIPGLEQSKLVRQGDTIGGLRILRVTRDSVRIAGYDTVWALAPRSSWQ